MTATEDNKAVQENPIRPHYYAPKSSPDWVPYFRYDLEPRYKGFWENVQLTFTRVPPWIPLPRPFSTLSTDFTRDRKNRGVKCSAALHSFFVLLVALSPFRERFDELTPEQQNAKLIYELEQSHQIIYLPPLKPKGDGGKPGKGLPEPEIPKAGSTIQSPKIHLVSNPVHPDNKVQTIQQEPVAPNLRLPKDQAIPNMSFAGNLMPEAPPPPVRSPALNLNLAKKSAEPLPPKPIVKLVPKRDVDAPGSLVASLVMKDLPAIANPSLPLPPPPMPEPVQIKPESNLGSLESMTDLTVVSVVPGPPADRIEIAPGNREAQFTVSPIGGAGAVGGSSESASRAGSGGYGPGGDRSVGTGTGVSGGGGGDATRSTGVIGINGMGNASGRDGFVGSSEAQRDLPPGSAPANKIYPVDVVPTTQGKGIVISAGPGGGGGLNVYGVLRGGKINTTYLAMPNRNWTLQFSLPASDSNEPQLRTVNWNLAAKADIDPPFPLKRFDFLRPPVPAEKNRMMLVLYGKITASGVVEALKVIKGVQPDFDELAMEAFSQWKFNPASIGDQAVAVEILVGIPVGNNTPTARSPANRSTTVNFR